MIVIQMMAIIKFGLAAVAAAVVTGFACVPVAQAQTCAGNCAPWSVTTVAADLGSLENLEFDGRGGLLV